MVKPLLPANPRVRIGGGVLALTLLAEVLFVYGSTMG